MEGLLLFNLHWNFVVADKACVGAGNWKTLVFSVIVFIIMVYILESL